MSELIKIDIVDSDSDLRIDRLIAKYYPDLSRSFIQKAIADGQLSVNGSKKDKSYKAKPGDEVIFTLQPPKELEVIPQNIALDIRYEDDDLLVVNKPQGMVVHPAPGNPDSTLVNALLYHCKDSLSGINGVLRPGIVHRIDKDTSGLLIVAKNDRSHSGLANQIKEHSFLREYRAMVCGHFKEPSGTIDKPIGRNPNDRKKMCVTAVNSKQAVTHYQVLEEFEKYSFVRLKLETGRTHQIRVHLSYLGRPVAGDPVYGTPEKNLAGQCLHAGLIGFIHPVTGVYIEVQSELPDYFKSFMGGCK